MCCEFSATLNGTNCIVIAVDEGQIDGQWVTRYKIGDRIIETKTEVPCTAAYRVTNEVIQLIRHGLILDFNSFKAADCDTAHALMEVV